jgi:hypothetical protein
LINQADIKSAGGVAPRVSTQAGSGGLGKARQQGLFGKNAPSLAGVARCRRRGVTVAPDSDGAVPDFQ